MPLLLIIVKLFASSATILSRIRGKNATSLPGILVELYWPFLIKPLTKDLDYIILITGTNGKTTTRGVINYLLSTQRNTVVTNRGGANIMRGIATALINNLRWDLSSKIKTAVLEVEEATLPRLAKYIRADQLIITNLLRDQLDAYGSTDQTGEYFQASINELQIHNSKLELVINNDDTKLLSFIPANFPLEQVTGFGVETGKADIQYEKNTIQDIESVKLIKLVNASKIITNWQGTHFDYIDIKGAVSQVSSSLPGLYNIYNILAGLISCNLQLEKNLASEVTGIQPVFGRGEIIHYKEAIIVLNLVKNPSGLDQVLSLVPEFAQNLRGSIVRTSIFINDNIADGKDVSWIWDSNLEKLSDTIKSEPLKYEHLDFFAGGSRGLDMLLRLQASNIPLDIDNYLPDTSSLIERIIEENKANPSNFFICGTYTAMMDIRTKLGQLVELPPIDSIGF